MKFKPIYLYASLVIISVVILIFVTQENSPESEEVSLNNEQSMPDDDVHKPLLNQTITPPSKENVTDNFCKKLAELKSAADENPKDTVALKNYAEYLAAGHKVDEAIEIYKKLLLIDPKKSDIHFELSVIYFNKKDLIKAESENNKVIAYDPDNQMALYNLGAITATRGNLEMAKNYWNRVIKINPESKTGILAKESLEKLN